MIRALLFAFALVLCIGIVTVGTVLDRASTRAFNDAISLAGGNTQ